MRKSMKTIASFIAGIFLISTNAIANQATPPIKIELHPLTFKPVLLVKVDNDSELNPQVLYAPFLGHSLTARDICLVKESLCQNIEEEDGESKPIKPADRSDNCDSDTELCLAMPAEEKSIRTLSSENDRLAKNMENESSQSGDICEIQSSLCANNPGSDD